MNEAIPGNHFSMIFSNELGLDVRDRVQQNFSEILKDITMYYTKKLDMLNIKLEHHQRTKMDEEHHELVHVRRKIEIH
jgi:hypothetical protein